MANDKAAVETRGQIITKTKSNFRKMTDLGNSKTHDLINKGLTDEYGNTLIDEDGHELKLQTVAVGSRRLIVIESWNRIIAYQQRHPIKLGLRGRRK